MAMALLILNLWASTDVESLFRGPLDTQIPTLKQVVGFGFGEDVTSTSEAQKYAETLANSSKYVSLEETGKSWEGRPLSLLVVTSTANQDNLDKIKLSYQSWARATEMESDMRRAQMQRLPICIWLAQSVHGNETSGTDSGLALAYYLAASQSPEAETIRRNSVVLIYLMQNPDGRERFVQNYRQSRGITPDPYPHAAEHYEPWPSGRPNHYLFDLNRDWFALTQAETKAKVATFLEWYPQVAIDLHEMGSDESFFVATPAAPANPLLPPAMIQMYRMFGQAIAEDFDDHGTDYFHSEVFDSFYPGYGESWPSLHGSVGLLFEQARSLGVEISRQDGSLLKHSDAVSHQLMASLAVIRHAVTNRVDILDFFYFYRKEAVLEGKELDHKQLFLLPGQDPLKAHRLAELLGSQGVEVKRIADRIRGLTVESFSTNQAMKVEIPAGSYVVRFSQPAGRLARTLLLPRLDMSSEFIEEQDRRYEKRQGEQFYDVTGWSLPLMHGVPAVFSTGSGWKGEGTSLTSYKTEVPSKPALSCYLIPYGQGAIQALSAMKDIDISFSLKPIVHNGVEFPEGSFAVRSQKADPNLFAQLTAWSRKFGFSFYAADKTWFDSGPSLGSSDVVPLALPRIALLWGPPCSSLSAGWLRYALEQMLSLNVTVIPVGQLEKVKLSEFQVVFMPSGDGSAWKEVLKERGKEQLEAWVKQGGVLVAVGETVDWLCLDVVGLLQTKREYRGGMVMGPDLEIRPEHPEKPILDPLSMIEPVSEFPRPVRGAMVRTLFDSQHWLAFGMQDQQVTLVDSNRIYRPLRLDKGQNVARYAADEIVVSGTVSDETAAQLAHKAAIMEQSVGLGRIIAFVEEPVYRGMVTGCLPLIANAVYFGSSMARQANY